MSNLIEGLCKATTALRGWQTDKTNKEKGYDYISSNAVLSRAGGALAENGIMVFPQIKEHGYEVGTTASNKPRYDAWVLMDFVVTAEGGEQMVCPWVCRGTDYSAIDVAIYKAITSGHKYFLMKLLNIGVGNDDSEHESKDAPEPAAAQFANKNTLKILHMVGRNLYGDDWDAKRPVLVKAKTKGRVTSSNGLFEEEAQSLIEGIEKRLEEQAAQQAHESTATAVPLIDTPAAKTGGYTE